MALIPDFLTNVAGAVFGSDYLRDFTHASKTFRPNVYEYAPKYKFLFHVYFKINPAAAPGLTVSGQDNFGLLVKSIKLPSYTFATHDMNQYNRKRIVQTKIKYDPIDVDFHDDNGDRISKLWYAYYTYYYKDATYVQAQGAGTGQVNPAPAYTERTLYKPSITGSDEWGFSGEPLPGSSSATKVPFFSDITIYGLNRHNFSAYTLINPIITRFGHDTYSYADGAGIMENKMTIDYEAVKYWSGAINGSKPSDKIPGFGDSANYDKTLSPISRPGSQDNILGQGGLLEGAQGVLSDFQGNNVSLSTLVTLGTTIKTASSMNLKQALTSELVAGATNAIQQTPNNRNQLFDLPIFKGAAGSIQGILTQPPIPPSQRG